MEFGSLAEIRKEAAAWLVEMDSCPEDWDRQRFQAWLRQSPRHIEEFLQHSVLWRVLDGVDSSELDLGKIQGSHNVVKWPAEAAAAARKSSGAKDWRRLRAPLTAAAAILAGVTIWLTAAFPGTQVIATGVGEQRMVKLQDGSVVELNARSRIEVRFTRTAREVRLIDGEALFSVEHDMERPTRPFTVVADNIELKALGTQFDVYRHAAGEADTVVSVIEGRIAVVERKGTNTTTRVESTAPQAQHSDVLTLVSAGEQARIGTGGEVHQTPVTNIGAVTSWRQRQLVFQGSSLAEVAEAVGRYNATPKVIIQGEKLRARRLTGAFSADDVESLIEFFEADKDLTVTRSKSGVVIRERSAQEPGAP